MGSAAVPDWPLEGPRPTACGPCCSGCSGCSGLCCWCWAPGGACCAQAGWGQCSRHCICKHCEGCWHCEGGCWRQGRGWPCQEGCGGWFRVHRNCQESFTTSYAGEFSRALVAAGTGQQKCADVVVECCGHAVSTALPSLGHPCQLALQCCQRTKQCRRQTIAIEG